MTEEGHDDSRFWFVAAAITLLTCSAALRFCNLGRTLFEDEVWVANLFRNGGLSPHSYNTPPLFYWLGRLWIRFGTADQVLRQPSAFFGVALAAVPFLAPLPRVTRFTWSVLLAFSSPLIFYSERLKQYTLEATAITVLIVLYLRAVERDERRRWIAFFATAVAGVLVLHTPIFISAALGAATLHRYRFHRPALLAAFFAIAFASAVAFMLYMAPSEETKHLHGDMDRWFEVTHRWVSSPQLLWSNTLEWVGQAFNLVRWWWIAAFTLAAHWLLRRRDATLAIVALIPPLLALIGSVLRVYPYGEVRLMILCLPGLFLVAADSIAAAQRQVRVAPLILIPFVLMALTEPYNRTYMRLPDGRDVYAMVARTPPTTTIYANGSYAIPLGYYYPELKTRIQEIQVPRCTAPGWYLQVTGTFACDRPSSLSLRRGALTATFVP